MSQPTIRHHEFGLAGLPLALFAFNAVMIPPRGPSPGQRSGTHSTPNWEYFSASPMIRTGAAVADCRIRQRRAISGSPSNSTSALSRPNRRLAPPARTNPRTSGLAVTMPTLWQRAEDSRFFLNRLTTRPSDSEFAQFFLQALAVQTDRRRGARHVPAMTGELFRQVRDLEFVLRLAKIIFAESDVRTLRDCAPDRRFYRRSLL